MLAAVFWSLLVPGFVLGFWQTALGFSVGMLGPWLLDGRVDRWDKNLPSATMLLLAVALHNISEGLAVGAGLAGRIGGQIDAVDAAALPLGIALQNVPDGVVVVLPLAAAGMTRNRVFAKGVLSGAVEPVASVLMILFSSVIGPVLPAFLGFAGGAMIHVVLTELTPQIMDLKGMYQLIHHL
jgi:ZIP family zinc transporter